VTRFPEQKFVLDHLAKPYIKAGQLQPWAHDLQQLARYPQVYAKLSGLVTEADWQHWRPSDIIPYLEIALAAFGPDRLLIGSDWPVCRLAGEYATVMQVIQDFIASLSPTEQENILGNNATRFYNLSQS
jgi:L-fuconolactonase